MFLSFIDITPLEKKDQSVFAKYILKVDISAMHPDHREKVATKRKIEQMQLSAAKKPPKPLPGSGLSVRDDAQGS